MAGSWLRRAVVGGVALLLGSTLGGSVAGAAPEEPLRYVALGDSYAAGPLIPPLDPNLACQRSDANYPNVAAAKLGAELTDVSCSGAVTDDFTSRQFSVVPPQFDALTPDTDLVSLTIGGNDVGLVQATLSCVNPLPEPIGISCAKRFTSGGEDEISARIARAAPTVGAAIAEITQRSPRARVVVVGYGTYLPKNGCYPITPLFPTDANYIQAKIDELNEALAAQAAAHDATFVDTREPGHDVCQPPSRKWLEGLIPTSPAAPLHPNAAGMRAFGAKLADAAR